MSSYPPSGSQYLPAEEYELSSDHDASHSAGPSRPQKTPRPAIHLNQSSSPLVLPESISVLPTSRRSSRTRPTSYLSPEVETPHRMPRAQFLNEELDPFLIGGGNEDVHVPDFGHMPGFNPDAGHDHSAVAQGMKNRWKKRLYLLMEEPSSGREAFFVHILVTGAILFRCGLLRRKKDLR